MITTAICPTCKGPFYRTVYIPKANGKRRRIEIPCPELMAAQRNFLQHEKLTGIGAGPYAFGCVLGKSAVDMARMHAGRNRKYVIRFDLKDAFHNVRPSHLLDVLRFERFTTEEIERRMEIPDWVAEGALSKYRYPRGMFSLIFAEREGGYPPYAAMGAPTSPYMLNLALKEVDFKAAKALRNFGPEDARYSRYVDDIVVSSEGAQAIVLVKKVIIPLFEKHDFKINRAKTKVMRNKSGRQSVVGVMVNDMTTLEYSKRNKLRGWMHRVYMMLLTGKNEKEEEVSFDQEGHIWHEMRKLNGFIDGWTQAAAPEHWEKIREKWNAICTVGKSRFPSGANPSGSGRPWLNPILVEGDSR